jgi:hypothetical protein
MRKTFKASGDIAVKTRYDGYVALGECELQMGSKEGLYVKRRIAAY